MSKNLFYLVLLHNIWLTHNKLNFLFKKKENYKDFYNNMNYNSLIKLWLSKKQSEKILQKKRTFDIDYIKKKLKERDVKIITINDLKYPSILKEIPNKPYFFYLRWKIDNSKKFSVIWSRNMTNYWKNIIQKIIPELSKYFEIVSWWAYGCDSEAHQETIKSWWKTISVIWTWIDIDYPNYNKKLYDDIVKNSWAIISIFPIWEQPNRFNFPIRNEIVAWLSIWTLVIEAKSKSWTLITSKLALELGRDLFAIPWDISRFTSEWCNNLIKLWEAKLITNSIDILEEYNIKINNKQEKRNISFSDSIQKEIFNLLLSDKLSIDDLSRKLDTRIQIISQKIWILEIKWIIKRWNLWKYYII